MHNPEIAVQMPRIGDKAPDFSAKTTLGDLNLSDYSRGSWVILFSHPADFTPVCTTEMVQFAKEQNFFNLHQCKLIGLSIDSVHAHLAWVNNVYNNMQVELDFPIIADLDMNVSRLYGMIHPGESDTAAIRTVFFIDPDRIVRLIMYYPLNVGRNIEEIKRVLIALQTADRFDCALPANWEKGDKVIVPPPKTLEQMKARISDESVEKIDFYLAKKEIDD